MPLTSQVVTVTEWVTPTGVVLAVGGTLDAMGCRVVEQHLHRLIERWPGLYLTLDLDAVTGIDADATEDLVLTVVALRAGEARIGIAARGGPCRLLVARMGVELASTRWLGVTA